MYDVVLMQKPRVLLCVLKILVVVYTGLLLARVPASAGTERVSFFDRFGRSVVLGPPAAQGKHEVVLNSAVYEAGAFLVEFVSDTIGMPEEGFFSSQPTANKTLGEERRDVVCAVLRDISMLIKRPSQSEPVRIQVRGFYAEDNTTAARASSVFIGRSGESGILDGAVWITLNSGRNAYDLLEFAPEYHGFIEVNFAKKFNVQYNDKTFDGVDLYTVVLHEMIHALGFGSFIRPEGVSSSSGQKQGYYSRYDTHLYLKDGVSLIPLLSADDSCYSVRFNSGVAAADMRADCSGNSGKSIVFRHIDGKEEFIYSPEEWQEGGSLSHLHEKCSGGQLLMDHSIAPRIAKRRPHEREVQMLCDLGYSITGRYGTDSSTERYGVYDVCVYGTPVGVNDSSGSFVSGGSLELTLSALLGNDLGAEEADCIEIIEGKGSLSGNRVWPGDSVVVLTAGEGFYGTILLRYLPKSTRHGNITYVKVSVLPPPLPPCTFTGCNHVCNGGFEVNSQFGEIAPWRIPQPFMQGWWAASFEKTEHSMTNRNTPDVWRRLPNLWGPDSLAGYDVDGYKGGDIEVLGFPGGDYPIPDFPPIDTWDRDPLNRHMVGMSEGTWSTVEGGKVFGGEAIYQQLAKPLQADGSRYVLEFYASTRSIPYFPLRNTEKYIFRVYADKSAVADTVYPPSGDAYIVGTPLISGGDWQKVKIGPFTVPTMLTYLHIQGYPDGLPDSSSVYGFIDDVIIREAGIGIDTYVSDTYPCIGSEVTYTFRVCKDEPTDRQTSVPLINVLPPGMRVVGGDFVPDGEGRLFAVVAPAQFDTSNCAVLTLRAVIDSATVGEPLVNTILPVGIDSTCTEALGKTKATVYPAEPSVTLSLVAESPVCRNEEVDVRIEITNANVFAFKDAEVNVALGDVFEIVQGSVFIDGAFVQDRGLQHKAYAVIGQNLIFPQFHIQASAPASGQGLNRRTIQFRVRCKKEASMGVLQARVHAPGASCGSSDTSVVVLSTPPPVPVLPDDTTSCAAVELTALYSGCETCTFLWSTGEDTPTITVSDSGKVWVAITNREGCTVYDSCYVHREALLQMQPSPVVLVGEPGQAVSFRLKPEPNQIVVGRLYPFRIRLRFNRSVLRPEWLGNTSDPGCTEVSGVDCVVEITDSLGIPFGGYVYPEYRFRVLKTALQGTPIAIEEFVWLDCRDSIAIPDIQFELSGSPPGSVRQEPQGHFALEQNYPNPFSHHTAVIFETTRSGFVELFVTDLSGRVVARLVSSWVSAGRYTIPFQAGELSTGVYGCVLQAREGVIGRTMMLLH